MTPRNSPAAITIKDIAKELGLAHTTVSRALNDHPRISAATKNRVRKAARDLGYIANLGARTMRRGTAKVVGLIVPDIQNEFYSAAARAMAQQCSASGYHLILGISEDDPEKEEQHVRTLRENLVAGVLISPSPDPTEATIELLDSVPTVQILRFDTRLGSLVVRADDRRSIITCTEHLIDSGHRRIGFIGPPTQLSTGRQRYAGFRYAMQAAGLELDKNLLVFVTPRPECGESAFDRIHSHSPAPTAIVVASSRLVLGMLRAANRLQINIPESLSLVAYGDADWFSICTPRITAAALPIQEMSEMATKMLFDSLLPELSRRIRRKRVVFSTKLMIRN
ncbi:LacI family DNA-binding transcriptional regulator [Haliea sp. E1-2-M8]|uniref:LacI family DNA-binding transcriptional regulator n=1 Tax=Haliea sp. E1-2-M8 TaxID=3064706 RepID=UPI002726F8A9|nr:LacI family DNA-binding transcriptional regulator [Haliea sp. E1-2-M8]MDO8863789.1 LacI family DNA-binding transcriptional regulator [Haliea sp. E1-2-M8]